MNGKIDSNLSYDLSQVLMNSGSNSATVRICCTSEFKIRLILGYFFHTLMDMIIIKRTKYHIFVILETVFI